MSEVTNAPKENYFFAKNRLMVSRLLGVGLMVLIFIAAPALVNPSCTIPLDVIGFLLLVAGAMGRVWCSGYISGHKSRSLISKGPFSMCRNPLYFFSLTAAIGIGLSTHSIIILGLFILLYILIYNSTIRSEEAILERQFGDEYRAYKQHTPRLFPKCSLFSRDETSTIDMNAFDKSILDVSLFFIFYGLIKLVMIIHALNIISPAFFIY